tara:strand:- start:581 stop:1333 length:753 start_codon:yes stop_codon:yes gene_type:complete
VPSLSAHFDIALKSEDRGSVLLFDETFGAYLLGSVTPDIRIINKQDRIITHFSDLDNRIIGQGAENMYIQYPDLFNKANISNAKKAFISGYINHLVADETWIKVVYEPYFSNDLLFESIEEANVYDRVLQLDLDRLSRDSLNDMEVIKKHILKMTIDFHLDFLPDSIVVQWRDWLLESMSWGFSWERIRRLAYRQQSNNTNLIDQIAQSFLNDIPANLTILYNKLPNNIIDLYLSEVRKNYNEIKYRYLT